MNKIVIIGSSNTDLVIKSEKIPAPGETILGGNFMMVAGGKGANQAVAVARLGGNMIFIAKLGNDMFGEQALSDYKRDGISTDYIFRDNHAPSGIALICVDAQGENIIVVAPGANNTLSIADIKSVEQEILKSSYLLMQLEIPMEVVEYVAKLTTKNGIKIVLNPAPAAQLSDELLRNTYLITPNETEAELLTGVKINSTEDASRAADALLAKGVESVVITLGAGGSYIKNRDISLVVPARKVVAVDTTAAGDTFNGALCVALAENKDLISAVKFATLASSISVTRLGAQTSIPRRNEVEELMK